jgi:hypothetical protein
LPSFTDFSGKLPESLSEPSSACTTSGIWLTGANRSGCSGRSGALDNKVKAKASRAWICVRRCWMRSATEVFG